MDKNGRYILKALDDQYISGTKVVDGFPTLTENYLEAIIFDYKGVEALVEKMSFKPVPVQLAYSD